MNPPPSCPPPSDAELDLLLKSSLERTSPEFELRWRELRAQLAHPTRARLLRWPRILLWPGLATAALAALVLFVQRPSAPTPAEPQPLRFEELIALDAVLAPATALLDEENREALLHLPVRANL